MFYKKIYFVGIKGVGMASLAIIAKQAGFEVSGSDTDTVFITDELLNKNGIKTFIGFDSKHIKSFVKDASIEDVLFITTGAHGGFDNPESSFAKSLGFKVLSHGQAVGEFMDGKIFKRSDFIGISIAGSHGKTTTSALCASAFTFLGLDPSFTIGTSEVYPLGSPGHYGKGSYFIAEADEYYSEITYDRTPKFLYQKPRYAIVTNIDFDHPDVFNTIFDVEDAFSRFISNMPNNGVIFMNGDDKSSVKLIKKFEKEKRIITFGFKDANNYKISEFDQKGLKSSFLLKKEDKKYNLKLNLGGLHNAYNASGVALLLLELKVPPKEIAKSLYYFTGSKRRLEVVGKTKNNLLIIDDYAHHPKEIEETLKTVRTSYPGKNIVCVFQPHTYSRTKAMFSKFVNALKEVDQLILLPTFTSARETVDDSVLDHKLYKSILKQNINTKFLNEVESVVKYVISHYNSDEFILLIMGAGDVYEIASSLINSSI